MLSTSFTSKSNLSNSARKLAVTCTVWLSSWAAVNTTLQADEGMYPISELSRLDLNQKGMQLSASDIFNPDSPSLVDGICRVNGCTGSFVSGQGLIITNHHCAYDAIQKASTSSKDLLRHGFSAKNFKEELPAPGYVVRITEKYRDVSDDVLASIDADMDAGQRAKAIDKRRKEIEKQAEQVNPEWRAEVAEMFLGKTYVLFQYTFLKDVRLVFAPPESVGAFGGDIDNWEWPRHTGDFAFLRAYTAPDGKSADFSNDNVPYKPKRPIRVNPAGVDEEDFIFILGYPGRTLRQRTASYFRFEEEIRLPEIVDYYSWQLREMEAAGAEDRSVAIKLATRYKILANVEKRSRGQLQGLRRTKLLDRRMSEENQLKDFIQSDEGRRQKYSSTIPQIDQVYEEMMRVGRQEFALRELRTACRAMSFAFLIVDAAHEVSKEDLDREAPYMDRNLPLTRQQLKLDVDDWHPPTDYLMLKGMASRLARFSKDPLPDPVEKWLAKLEQDPTWMSKSFETTKLRDAAFVDAWFGKSVAELDELDDPFIQTMLDLYPVYKNLRDLENERDGKLGALYRDLQDVRMQFQGDSFIPDANATLRLTYGYVRRDRPADAITRSPITTFRGVLEKTTGVEPFITPQVMQERYARRDFGTFVDSKLGDIPVGILYNADTTGGNSGSPVLNANGELIGVNFDRTFQATINDFAWSESYSRSIGVDIRYVLWVTGVVYDAPHLLRELGL